MTDIPPLPKPGTADRIKVATTIGTSLVPVVGGAAAAALSAVIPSTLERRRRIWEEWVASALVELQDRSLDPEKLGEDDRFVTAVIHTTRIAVGTHLEEKLRLLAGCLKSVALDPPTDFLTDRFLRWVDELSPEHFDELASHDHRQPNVLFAERLSAMLDGRIDMDARRIAEKDLVREGLLDIEETDRPSGRDRLTITSLGRQLLDFVRYMTEGDEPGRHDHR